MDNEQLYSNKQIIDKQFEVIRVFGSIIIVFMHSSIMYGGYGVVFPKIKSEFFKFFSFYFYSFMIELFMLLSGITYGICLNKSNEYSDAKFVLFSKFKRLMIPYYLAGILYVAPIMIILKITNKNYFKYVLIDIILGKNCRHLWLLLALFDNFIFIIILRSFITSEKKEEIILIISIFLLLITREIPDILCLNRALYFFLFFSLGYFIHNKIETINLFFSQNLSLWFSLGFATFPLSLFGRAIHGRLKAIQALPGVFFYFYFARIICQSFLSNNIIFDMILKNGFGIYIIHPMLIYFMYFKYGQNNIKPWILVFSTTITAIIFSLIISVFLRLFHLGFLFGEI